MLRATLNSTHVRARVILTILALGVASACVANADNLETLSSWAEHTAPQAWQGGLLFTVQTPVEDHFGRNPYEAWKKRGQNGLGYPGLALPTAGVGSSWVYDPIHHIAAGTGYNDDGGWDDQISYSASPPSKIPARNLSGVVSARGLRLGVTPRQAATDLDISVSAVRSLDAHYSALSVLKKCPLPKRCTEFSNYFAVVVFRDGRAVYIKMGIIGGM